MARVPSVLPPSATTIVVPSRLRRAQQLIDQRPIWAASLRQGITIMHGLAGKCRACRHCRRVIRRSCHAASSDTACCAARRSGRQVARPARGSRRSQTQVPAILRRDLAAQAPRNAAGVDIRPASAAEASTDGLVEQQADVPRRRGSVPVSVPPSQSAPRRSGSLHRGGWAAASSNSCPSSKKSIAQVKCTSP